MPFLITQGYADDPQGRYLLQGFGESGVGILDKTNVLPTIQADRIWCPPMLNTLPANNGIVIRIEGLRDKNKSLITGDVTLTAKIKDSAGVDIGTPSTFTETPSGTYTTTLNISLSALLAGSRYKILVYSTTLGCEWVRWFKATERPFLNF